MSTTPEWRFRRMQPGEMNIDPTEAEFFSTEALGSLADALVREAIQNSLDARRSGETLRLRIYFPPSGAFPEGDRRDRYLEGLSEHLRSSRTGLSVESLPDADEPLSFLVIEDFGTRGLQGDPAQSEDVESGEGEGTRNDFFYFWRNVGRSRKHAAELGRWGLGKTVFQAASRINSFFGLTVRADDGRRLLLGQSVLKIHKLRGHRTYPYGYFGAFDKDFALPLEDGAELERFERAFGLERREAPGLSVVLPYPDAEITPEAIVESVLRHYFLPILSGDLSVVVEHADGVERLDAESSPALFSAAASGAVAQLGGVFELARWSIHVPAADHVRLAPPPETSAPRWDDEALPGYGLRKLRERFDAGRPIAVTAPVWVKPVGERNLLSEFNVYLLRDELIERADEHFVRDGITVTGVRTGLPRGIRLIVSIRDKALSTLVGDSENPAHTEWQERSLKFKDRYHHGPFTLRYIRSVPRELVRLLTRPSEDRDFALLKQLFSLDLPTESEIAARTADPAKAGMGGEAGAGEFATVGTERALALQKLRGGFRVKGVGDDGQLPRRALVRVAYEVRRGNPFRQYHPLDFDLAEPPIELKGKHVRVVACRHNAIVLEPEQNRFELTVRGFDVHRDLRVRVQPVEADTA
jgi:hypothetical protein